MNCIYQYINKINGHMYIGLTKDPKRRFNDHLQAAKNPNNKDYNLPLHRAIRKYGIQNFDFNILEDNLKDTQEMKEREIYWIKFFNAYEDRKHYNETPGGDLPGYNTVHLGEEHGMAKLTTEEVIFCRKCYAQGLRKMTIYNQYFKDKIGLSGFSRMWHGETWQHIMPEVFNNNPHRGKYGAQDRDKIITLYKASGLSLSQFQKTKECFVGYGTLWKMVNNPSFYDNK